MKILGSAVLAVVFSAGAFAQHHGGGGGRGFGGGGHGGGGKFVSPPLFVQQAFPFRTFGSPSGFGNVVFPGTGTPPPFTSAFSFPFTGAFPSLFPERFAADVAGFGFTGAPSNFDRFGGFGGFGFGAGAIPYPVPVYGGGYDNGGQQPPANVTIVMPPQQYAAPGAPVTINQNFLPEGSRPVIQEYGPSARQNVPEQSSGMQMYGASPAAAQAYQADDDQVMFLIALKDSSVYSAVAYWVQGETLNYITPQGKRNQVSLALVDRAVSQRLNSGRKVEFQLPDGK